uniref:Sideroflexin 2 n=2 Tax=Cercopithecinae TaxID=9528 RepID=A0A2K5MI23_CERAT
MMYPVRGTEGSTVLCVNKMEADLTGFNIDAPRWDQRTFLGRVKHFLNITDPRTVFVSEQELDWAKMMVEKSRMGVVPPGTQVEQLLYAKKLYDSAFHPDTGEKMNVIGRMSFQLPGGMIITGFMLQFYRTMPAVIFWQWVNQSFNALVNYTNRNAASPISVRKRRPWWAAGCPLPLWLRLTVSISP